MPALTALRRHADTNCTIVPICKHSGFTNVHTKHATICATDRNSVEMHAPRQSLHRPHFEQPRALPGHARPRCTVVDLSNSATVAQFPEKQEVHFDRELRTGAFVGGVEGRRECFRGGALNTPAMPLSSSLRSSAGERCARSAALRRLGW